METIINVNLKTGESSTTKGNTTYVGMDGFIASQRDMLAAYRDDGREPSQELLDDIAAYEFILENKLTKEYMDWRHGGVDAFTVRPRQFPPFVASLR